MLSIGLTGGIGSGKTTVAKRFAEYGVAVIDTDCIAHALTSADGAAIPLISAQFGQAFITPNHSLDRAKMRAVVFSDQTARQRLEAILHPLILAEYDRAVRIASGTYLLSVVPLLVESSQWKTRFDRILVIDCAQETQIARVMQRSHLSREQVLSIIAHQTSRAERLAHADDVICNNETITLNHLFDAIGALHRRYLNFCASHSEKI